MQDIDHEFSFKVEMTYLERRTVFSEKRNPDYQKLQNENLPKIHRY